MRSLIPNGAALVVSMLIFLVVAAFIPNARAQVVSSGDIWQSVAAEPDVEAAERATITRVLEHPVTRELARSRGLDLRVAEARVSVLQGAELNRVAGAAAAAESNLGASGAIVISQYALIIILLVLIVLLLA